MTLAIYGTTTKIAKVLCMNDTRRMATLIMEDYDNHYVDERPYEDLSIGDSKLGQPDILPHFYRKALTRITLTGDLK